jgi:hypothetical protein
MNEEFISEKEKIEDMKRLDKKFISIKEKIKDLKTTLMIIEEKGDCCPHRMCDGYYRLKELIEFDIMIYEIKLKELK